jgi:hypothetical protein
MKSFIFALLFIATSSFAATDRIALVVGNSKYAEFGTLANPANDARDINKALTEMGYKTRLVLDANESTIRKEFRNFAAQSDSASIAVVFYAGHGAQVNGENYLLPVDMDVPKRESDIQLSALKIDDVINSIKSKTKVIFLDACRDNPALIKSLSKGRGSYRGGLAATNSASLNDQSSGIFIAYATDAGNVASDGISGDKNSPFTAALLQYIKQPVSIDDMFSMVTKDVRQKTKNTQKPYKYASLEGVICLPGKCGNYIEQKNVMETSSQKTSVKAQVSSNSEMPMWVLFQRLENPRQLIYMDFKNIKINGSRVSTIQKWVNDEDGSFDVYTFVMDCKSLFGTIIRLEKYDKNGNQVSNSVFGNIATAELKNNYSNNQSIGFSAIQIACNPDKSAPLVGMDQLSSSDWESFYTIKPGVTLHFLKSSLRQVNIETADGSSPLSLFSNLIRRNASNEGEIITKLTFPRTKGSEMKKAINIELGLGEYKNVPYASTLVSKVRFICDKKTNYQLVENWFDEDGKFVGISSAIDVDISIGKENLLPNHPESILAQLSKLVCKTN